MMDVTAWYLKPDGTVSPDEWGEDEAIWEAEVPDPDGDYWCDHCHGQFNADELDVVHEPSLSDPTSWEQRIKTALLSDLKL